MTESEKLLSPGRLLFRLVAAVFVTELLVMLVLFNWWKPATSVFGREFLDSLALALLILPFLWLWIIRPLGSAAIREKLLAANIISSSVDAIITIDEHGNITAVNPAAEKLFGYAKQEAIGKNIKLIVPAPERDQHDTYIERYLRTGEQRIIGAGREVNGQRKDGSTIPLHLSISETRVADRRMFTGIMHDLTSRHSAQEALQASELRYRRLFESAKDGILILDADSGQIVDVNPFLVEMLGYSEEEFVGKELWEIGFFKDVVDSKAAFVELQEKGYIRYEDLPLETRGGVTRQVEFVSNSYRVNGSRVIQCNIRDISERKLAESELKATHQRLEQAFAELQVKRDELTGMTQQLWQASKLATMGELSASIAHELNNPLATVSLRAENLLMQLQDDPDKRRSLEIIAQEVDRMAMLVNSLLQFSRRSHREVSTIDLREEIATSVEFVHYHLRSHNIEVVREFADGLPTIQADRQQLRQLFLNLLNNASDAMNGSGRLTLRATPAVLEGTAAVQVEFTDTGEGISAENLEKIWEPFFTTKPEGKGTGLGLAICRRIVEEHGGTIDVQSQAGRGTTVRIVFPATSNGS